LLFPRLSMDINAKMKTMASGTTPSSSANRLDSPTRPVPPPPLSKNSYVDSLIAIHKGQGTLIKASDVPTESPTKFAEFAYVTHRVIADIRRSIKGSFLIIFAAEDSKRFLKESDKLAPEGSHIRFNVYDSNHIEIKMPESRIHSQFIRYVTQQTLDAIRGQLYLPNLDYNDLQLVDMGSGCTLLRLLPFTC